MAAGPFTAASAAARAAATRAAAPALGTAFLPSAAASTFRATFASFGSFAPSPVATHTSAPAPLPTAPPARIDVTSGASASIPTRRVRAPASLANVLSPRLVHSSGE